MSTTLELPPQNMQDQRDLTAQLETVKAWFRRNWPVDQGQPTSDNRTWVAVATRLGCYDAADFIKGLDAPVDWTRL
jgi:hypothetical protein